MSILGADISKWQGDEIDWVTVGDGRLQFLVMKATQGTRVDPEFLENWRDCAHYAPRIVRGAYHLVELDDPIEPQVRAFLSAVPDDGWPLGALPPFLDIETSKIDEIPDNPKVDRDKILEWCARVEHATGVRPMIYLSPRGLRHLKGCVEGLDEYGLWHVEYISGEPGNPKHVPSMWDRWSFWQYTSGKKKGTGRGKEFGMESNGLDLDLFNGTRAELEALARQKPGMHVSALDVEGALAYNASRRYAPSLEGRIVSIAGAHPWNPGELVRAIARWQSSHGLKADGMVGQRTLVAMGLQS